jgi:inner membrane protein
MLPDIDVTWVGLGVPDVGLGGHRGLTHTPAFALAMGLVAGLVARRLRLDAVRAATAITLVLLSHGLLDGLAQEGRGVMAFWPLSNDRYHFLWRPIPDAPRGLELFSRKGMSGFLTELAYFAPFTIYALTPRVVRLRPAPQRPGTPKTVKLAH